MAPTQLLVVDSMTRRQPTKTAARRRESDDGMILVIPTPESISISRSRSHERKSQKPTFAATKKQNHKRRQGKRRTKPSIFVGWFVLLLLLFVWCGFQWKAYLILQDGFSPAKFLPWIGRLPRKSNDVKSTSLEPVSNTNESNNNHASNRENLRFIIFHQLDAGQGVGNNLHGLLSAHLLAVEFRRIVCVSPDFQSFHLAFESIHPLAVENCPGILRNHDKGTWDTRPERTIYLLNYKHAPNECHLKEKLASQHHVLHLQGNTYPRWPKVVQDNFFFQFYKAKPDLLAILPYSPYDPPKTVVHLRQPDLDGSGDTRFGVDFASLRALGNYMKSKPYKPYVVTNNVAWFDMYEKDFGWRHPHWQAVKHSALGMKWDGRHAENDQEKQYSTMKLKYGPDGWEHLKLYADWYALLTAEEVYHTYSDFSLSAVHWNNKVWSRTYDGLSHDNGDFIFVQENWIVDGETPRLIDRSNAELRLCDQHLEEVDT